MSAGTPEAAAASGLEPSAASLQFSLLPARRDDLPAILRLEGEGFGPDERWSERSWAGELLGERRTVLLARGAQPAGVVALSTVGELADLHRIVVAPAHRRQGLGQRLVRAGLLAVRHLGARAVMLEVEWDNLGAIALYQRLGFEQLRVRRDYYGQGRDALILKLYDLQTWPGRFAEAVRDTEADLLRERSGVGLRREGGRPPTPPGGFRSLALPEPEQRREGGRPPTPPGGFRSLALPEPEQRLRGDDPHAPGGFQSLALPEPEQRLRGRPPHPGGFQSPALPEPEQGESS